MSKKKKNKNKNEDFYVELLCGDCINHLYVDGDFCCVCPESPKFGEETTDFEGCDCWEDVL